MFSTSRRTQKTKTFYDRLGTEIIAQIWESRVDASDNTGDESLSVHGKLTTRDGREIEKDPDGDFRFSDTCERLFSNKPGS